MTLSHIRNKSLQRMDTTISCTNKTEELTASSTIRTGFDQILLGDYRRTGSLDEQLKNRHLGLKYTYNHLPTSIKKKKKEMNTAEMSSINFCLDKLSCRCEDGVVLDDDVIAQQQNNQEKQDDRNMKMDLSLIDYDSDPEYRYPMESTKRSCQDEESTECRSEPSVDWPMDTKELAMHEPVDIGLILNHAHDTLQVLKSHGMFMHLCTDMKKNDPCAAASQTCLLVKLWMEMGHNTGDLIIQPKLVWRSGYNRLQSRQITNTMHDRHLNQHHQHRSILPIPESTGTIDLLNILRIISSPNIDREQYPLVSKQNCFMIITSTTRLLFEALTSHEKDSIVAALKILVSRFVSMIACEDIDLIDEFFLPLGMMNPK